MKKVEKIEVTHSKDIPASLFKGPLDELIVFLQGLQKDGWKEVNYYAEYDRDDHEIPPSIFVNKMELETDKEFKHRQESLKREKERKEKEEKEKAKRESLKKHRRYTNYLRLKKEFERD